MNKCFLPIALGLSICCNAVHGCSGKEDREMWRFHQREARAFIDIFNRCVENNWGNLDDIRLLMPRIQVHERITGNDVLLHFISGYVMSVLENAKTCVDFSGLTREQVEGFNFVYGLFCNNERIVIPANLRNNSQLYGAFFGLVFAIKKVTEVCLNAQNDGRTVDNQFIEEYSQVFQLLTQAFEPAVNRDNIGNPELLDNFINAVEVIRLAYVDHFRYMFMID